MMEFAVAVKDVDTGDQARWVLDIDRERERFLIADPDGVPRYVPMADCKVARVVPPDQPLPRVMIPGQAKQEKSGLDIVKIVPPGNHHQ